MPAAPVPQFQRYGVNDPVILHWSLLTAANSEAPEREALRMTGPEMGNLAGYGGDKKKG